MQFSAGWEMGIKKAPRLVERGAWILGILLNFILVL